MPSKPPVAMLDMSLLQSLDRGTLERLGCAYYQCIFGINRFIMLLPASWLIRIPCGTKLVTTSGIQFTVRQDLVSNTIILDTPHAKHAAYLCYGFPIDD